MNRFPFGLGASALVCALASVALPACGSDDDAKAATGGTGGASGGSGGASGGSAGASGSSGSAGSAGQGGSAGSSACNAYCETIGNNCAGVNAQYPSKAACVAACAAVPVGAPSDTIGNSLYCRAYHADAAAGDAVAHCAHAGPSGADTCGSPCEGYCNLMLLACSSEYTDRGDCTTKCATFTGSDAKDYNTGIVSGDSLNCRIYHATVAASDPSGGTNTIHCPHAGATPTDQCL